MQRLPSGKAAARFSLAAAVLALSALVPVHMMVRADSGEASPADAAIAERGRALFTETGCVQCHTLADAGATGTVGPVLDGNPRLSRALIVDRLTHGQGDMPGFLGILTEEEIEQLATYLLSASKDEGA